MLKSFYVKNFRSFKDELKFDLSKIKNYEFNSEVVKNDLVNKTLIYGKNSSGKSNLGLAIFDIISHLTDYNKGTNLYQNYLNLESTLDYATFVYEFKFGKTEVKYAYTKSSHEELISEELYFNDKMVIKYDKTISPEAFISLKGAEHLKRDLKESKLSVLKYVKNNIIYSKTSTLGKFFTFVDGMLFFKSVDSYNYIGLENGSNDLSEIIIKNNLLNDFQKFLKDMGIILKLGITEEYGKKVLAIDYGKSKVPFSNVASTGTKSLWLFYCWIFYSEKISFLFIDEFDAFYHHELSEGVIRKLKKLKNTQVILTTHSPTLMNNDLLRPDAYFIIENYKIKPICDYTVKDIRKAHNLEKMYKAGIFNEENSSIHS
ncbi:MAG: AAA family ATPase [Cetobacterium sp.]